MRKRWKPAELVATVSCDGCGKPVKLHGAPLGEPAFLLMIGHCHHCGGSQLDVRTDNRLKYSPPPSVQIAGMFLKVATGQVPPSGTSLN